MTDYCQDRQEDISGSEDQESSQISDQERPQTVNDRPGCTNTSPLFCKLCTSETHLRK